jgi:hypothetical protein
VLLAHQSTDRTIYCGYVTISSQWQSLLLEHFFALFDTELILLMRVFLCHFTVTEQLNVVKDVVWSFAKTKYLLNYKQTEPYKKISFAKLIFSLSNKKYSSRRAIYFLWQ